MAGYYRPEFTRGTLSVGSETMRIHMGLVGPGFFQLLGTAPVLGRTFDDSDYVADPRSVVISYGRGRTSRVAVETP